MPAFDVVVIGAGAMGSAALYQLARRGLRVLGLERFAPGHDRGSSHGRTRIIRLGYFEHPSYVPLLRRAYAAWRSLEQAAGEPLLHVTGIAEIGPPEGELVQGTLAAARLHDLPHEVVDARTLMQRLPAFRIPSHFVGVLQPEGGYLEAEKAVQVQAALAAAGGAVLRCGVTVQSIEPQGSGVRLRAGDETIDAGAAVITAGAWAARLIPQLGRLLRPTRQVLGWFAPQQPALFARGRFPVFLLESEHGLHYGFPLDPQAGLKIAKHHHLDETADPDTVDRNIRPRDEAAIRAAIAAYFPQADGPLVTAQTCLYTMAPDGHFIIDRLPGAPQILIASPCSGHGFKFAPVIGEIVADLVASGSTAHDISHFALARFA